MKDKRKGAAITAAAVAALGLGGTAIAAGTSGGGDDDSKTERAITGQALERAEAVALSHTGGGKVTETEVGDEEGAYEVEVIRADGSEVDVHLDTGFKVINESSDSDQGEDEGGSDD